ncbi:MAG: hypothetical protein JWO35_383 [Candidatus Saccharibacteria bacterium]|nr:hypothetical protein [Candidatus Saccharibacteria bacterium]
MSRNHRNQPPDDTTDALDVVYHFSSSDKFDLNAPLELQPNPARGKREAWRKLETFIDERRPKRIRELGITRQNAVFANPTATHINSEFSWGAWPERANLDDAHRIAIGIEVNPDKVVVCDAGLLDSGIVEWAHASEKNTQFAAEMADRYWSSAISLSDFRRLYQANFGGQRAVQKVLLSDEEPDSNYPLRFLEPEVLVPGPIINDHLHLAAMGIHHQINQFKLYGDLQDDQVTAA